jgi:hypothetical protein
MRISCTKYSQTMAWMKMISKREDIWEYRQRRRCSDRSENTWSRNHYASAWINFHLLLPPQDVTRKYYSPSTFKECTH